MLSGSRDVQDKKKKKTIFYAARSLRQITQLEIRLTSIPTSDADKLQSHGELAFEPRFDGSTLVAK